MLLSGKRVGIGLLVGLVSSATAFAADVSSTGEVLGKVHRSNLTEIEMGKMAQNHGMSKDVKDFGKALVKDHSSADKKVVKLAKDEKIDLTAATPPADAHPDQVHTGTAFDDAFAKDMLADHKKDIADVTTARDATTDQKLKQLLTDILPVLNKHESIAQKLVDHSATHSASPLP
jgi:putative membrane protein